MISQVFDSITRNTYPHNCLARTPRPHAQPGHVLTNYEYVIAKQGAGPGVGRDHVHCHFV